MKQPGLSNAAAGKIPQICATSPASEKKIRSRPLAQPTIQGLNLITFFWGTIHSKIRTNFAENSNKIRAFSKLKIVQELEGEITRASLLQETAKKSQPRNWFGKYGTPKRSLNETKLVLNHQGGHSCLGPIWYKTEPSDVLYSPNEFLVGTFFCRFLKKTGSRTPLRHFEIFKHYKNF